MNNISIGIIGGMGPQASALLHQLIIKAATSQLKITECSDFPLITHVSIPATDFISQPELRHSNRQLIMQAVNIMAPAKPNVVVIACNTAHLLVNEIPELQALPLISLPHTALQEAAKKGVKRLGLLASPTTIRSKLYHTIAELQGIELITLDTEGQRATEKLIRSVIAGAPLTKSQHELKRLVQSLREQKVESVILGCTELSVAGQNMTSRECINPLQAVVDRIVHKMRTEENQHA